MSQVRDGVEGTGSGSEIRRLRTREAGSSRLIETKDARSTGQETFRRTLAIGTPAVCAAAKGGTQETRRSNFGRPARFTDTGRF